MVTISDEQIKKDIVDQLYWDERVDASDIEVYVNNGEVTLRGSAPNYKSIQSAWDDAWTARGVLTVNNEIKVSFPGTFTVPSDEELKTSIQSMLRWNPSIDAGKVDVSVNNGIATLEGTVDSYWKKIKATELAFDVIGVVNVENHLCIVPSEKYVDVKIAEDIMQTLKRNLFVDEEAVDVKVEDGVVTLSGFVPDWSQMHAAMEAAKYTPGVIEVKNNLLIKPSANV